MNQVAPVSRRAGMLDAMMAGTGTPQPARVSVGAQRFTLIDAGGNKLPLQLFDQHTPGGFYLDVVIIDVNAHKGRVYYDKPFNPAEELPPACFSEDSITPSPAAAVQQHPTCAGCPQAVWGSKVSAKGAPIPACSEHRNLAVIIANDQIPEVARQMAFRFKIPPASLKNISDYGKMLMRQTIDDVGGPRVATPADVITRAYFDQENQGELLFHMIGFAKPYEALIEMIDNSGELDTIVGRVGTPQVMLPPPTQQRAIPQMQPPPPAAPRQPIDYGVVRSGSPPAQPAPTMADLPRLATPQMPDAPVYPAGTIHGGYFSHPPGQQPPPSVQPIPPAARTRRGGSRTGAGRPAAQPGPAPTVAPFQQGAPAQQVQQPVPFGQPPSGGSPPTTTFPSNPGMPDMPAFLQRAQPAAAAPGNPGGGPAFGMQNGTPPDPALKAALENAFGAPLQPRQR